MTALLVIGAAVVSVAAVALGWLLVDALKHSDAASWREYQREREGEGRDV